MFAQQGAKVVLVSRTLEKLEAVAKEIENAGGQAAVVTGDVSLEATSQAMVKMAMEKFGRLDIVFANAGAITQAKITRLQ